MQTLTYIFAGVALLAVLFGINAYMHLYKWARMCQRATIAIAYNQRVQMNAPLTEWLTWCNALNDKERERGRVVFKRNKLSVAILRPDANIQAKTTFRKIRRWRRAGKENVAT